MEGDLQLRAENPNNGNTRNTLRRFSMTSPTPEATQQSMDKGFPMHTKLDSNRDYCQLNESLECIEHA